VEAQICGIKNKLKHENNNIGIIFDNNYLGKKWKQYPVSKNLIILINNFEVKIGK